MLKKGRSTRRPGPKTTVARLLGPLPGSQYVALDQCLSPHLRLLPFTRQSVRPGFRISKIFVETTNTDYTSHCKERYSGCVLPYGRAAQLYPS
jgi:hypothetical protein